MKKILFPLLFLAALLISSCTLESSSNGSLDGFWHLERIDTLKGGGVNMLAGKRIFWSVQHNLLQLSDLNGDTQACLSRFSHQGDSLILSEPYLYDREQGDQPIADVAKLAPFGVNSLNERFKIEQLSTNEMRLVNTKHRLYFVKF